MSLQLTYLFIPAWEKPFWVIEAASGLQVPTPEGRGEDRTAAQPPGGSAHSIAHTTRALLTARSHGS